MVESRNLTAFWFCATLALSITMAALGATILFDAATLEPATGSHINLRPGGGVLSVILGAAFMALAFQAGRLATVLAISALALASVLAVLPYYEVSTAVAGFAVTPPFWVVTALVAASIVAAIGWPEYRAPGVLAGLASAIVGLVSLLSKWFPALSALSLGSVPESTVVVSPLVMLAGALLPFLPQVFRRTVQVPRQGPIVIGAIAIVITTFSWHFLRVQHSEYLMQRANALADQLEATSLSAYQDKLALIRRMSERWELLDTLPSTLLWQQEVSSYLRDHPDLRLMAIIDPQSGHARTRARSTDSLAWLNDLLHDSGFADWQEHVLGSGSVHLGQPRLSGQGQALAAIGMPVDIADGKTRLLMAVVDMSRVFEQLTRHLDQDMNVRVYARNIPVFEFPPERSLPDNQAPIHLLTRTVKAQHDTQWTLDISIPEGVVPPGDLYLPPLVLFSGLGLSFLVMLIHLFWRESEQRSESLESLNQVLNYHLDQERSLRQTNERILEYSRDLLCSIGKDGRFLQVSPASEALLGYRPTELIGTHYRDLLAGDNRLATEDEIRLLLNGKQGRATGFRTRLSHRSGQVVTVAWSAEWSSEDEALFCVGRDISNELMAETLTRERDQFFSLSPDMFCIMDLNTLFFEVNNTFVETLGYDREDLIGTSYLELIHPDDHHLAANAVTSLLNGHQVFDLVLRLLDRDRSEHWLNINAILSADELIYVVARDTTEQRVIEQKLRESEALLRMAEQVAMLGGWALDLETGNSTWSDAVCIIHDLPAGRVPPLEEAIRYYIPEHRESIRLAIQTCIDTGMPFDKELQIRTAQGRLRWVRAIGHPVKDDNGRITRLQGALQDITASKRAMEQIKRFAERQATIFESITDAFFTLDRNWCFTYINRRSEELLRQSRDELLGYNLWEMFPGALGTEFERQYRHAMETGESVSFEGYYEPLDNWLEISAYPYEEGLAVYYRSIRERKEAQWQLEATLQELERSNRELQDFAFVASHDLQEPLRKIQAFSDRLITRSTILGEQERDYLRRMQSAAGRMQNLIDDLLSYSRVTTRAKPMASCNTRQILGEVLQDMETAIGREQAQIRIDDLPDTHGDPTQLRQVFQNLLSNAIKFHAPERTPEIHIHAGDLSEDSWTLVVADNGIGFDERYAEKLFLPFQRLHQNAGYAGTGIGMAIVKKILDRHQATVSVNSVPGSGTSFRIRFKRG